VYIDKTILIGITHLDTEGNILRQEQYHGVIESVSETKGVSVKCVGLDENFFMPPNTSHYIEAAPGEYKEHNTGDTIVDPDYLCAWEVTWPKDKSKNPNWKPISLEKKESNK